MRQLVLSILVTAFAICEAVGVVVAQPHSASTPHLRGQAEAKLLDAPDKASTRSRWKKLFNRKKRKVFNAKKQHKKNHKAHSKRLHRDRTLKHSAAGAEAAAKRAMKHVPQFATDAEAAAKNLAAARSQAGKISKTGRPHQKQPRIATQAVKSPADELAHKVHSSQPSYHAQSSDAVHAATQSSKSQQVDRSRSKQNSSQIPSNVVPARSVDAAASATTQSLHRQNAEPHYPHQNFSHTPPIAQSSGAASASAPSGHKAGAHQNSSYIPSISVSAKSDDTANSTSQPSKRVKDRPPHHPHFAHIPVASEAKSTERKSAASSLPRRQNSNSVHSQQGGSRSQKVMPKSTITNVSDALKRVRMRMRSVNADVIQQRHVPMRSPKDTSSTYAPPLQSKPRLFFLFLTRSGPDRPELWDAFFQRARKTEGLEFKPFVHCTQHDSCKAKLGKSNPSNFTQVPTVDTFYCSDLVGAMVQLLKFALRETVHPGDKFIFLSESTLPTKPFSFVYSALTADDKSEFCISNTHWWSLAHGFYRVLKHDQWAILNSRHSQLLVEHWPQMKAMYKDHEWKIPVLGESGSFSELLSFDDTGLCADEWAVFASIYGALPPEIDRLDDKHRNPEKLHSYSRHRQGACRTFVMWDAEHKLPQALLGSASRSISTGDLEQDLLRDWPGTQLECSSNITLPSKIPTFFRRIPAFIDRDGGGGRQLGRIERDEAGAFERINMTEQIDEGHWVLTSSGASKEEIDAVENAISRANNLCDGYHPAEFTRLSDKSVWNLRKSQFLFARKFRKGTLSEQQFTDIVLNPDLPE